MEDIEAERVIELCRRLEPIIHRFILKTIDNDGINVTLSVVSNLATSFMAQAIAMVETRGGDIDQFVKILMVETKNKYEVASAQVHTELALSKMMGFEPDPNSSIH